ncbi:type II toxin-antitoxin system VapC family toxin [Cryobacterium sp. PH31-O1]|uniref:type II toxin-antitoxin system VapC family toxin n=1 Tax=Cryobacterium sp. PH31-O1 TaxID=3046306 RepID=UPI0024BA9A19|nr:type II toxin-antitoxin system VapC family toxin [Cryobacterium sp. PH31-O1]MDJ0337598.1 type II toxin-antitoxin system VapC family toxin [Cryobacterium sp. PH31-O1]
MTTTRGLLDTSVFVARESNRPLRVDLLPLEQVVSAITLGELSAGVHAAVNADSRAMRMKTLDMLSAIAVLPVDAEVAAIWARLRQNLRDNGRRLNVNDLWIASTALAHSLPVYTQDTDFQVLSDLGGPEVIVV